MFNDSGVRKRGPVRLQSHEPDVNRKNAPRLRGTFALAALLWSGAGRAADQQAAIYPAPLFKTAAIHFSTLKMFPKWRRML